MEEEQIKKLMQGIKVPEPEKEFVDKLSISIEEKANKLYERKNTHSFSILGLWKMSLVFSSLVIISAFTFIIYSSPETLSQIQTYLENNVESAFSDEVQVKLTGDVNEVSIFLFDQLKPDTPPLDVKIQKNSDNMNFSIYPGKYRLVAIKQDKEVLEKEFVVKLEDNVLEINLEFTK